MISPLQNFVLVKDEKVEDQTLDSGIILAATVNSDDAMKARVIAVGPKVENVKVGDLVVVTKFVGDVIEHEQEKFKIIVEEFDGDLTWIIRWVAKMEQIGLFDKYKGAKSA